MRNFAKNDLNFLMVVTNIWQFFHKTTASYMLFHAN